MNELPPIGPGMPSTRRCYECGAALIDDARCGCQQQLSVTAERAGQQRRQQRDELRKLELATMEVDTIIRQLTRKLDLYGHHSAKGHRRHPRQIT